jgi:uncharacterized protein YbcI
MEHDVERDQSLAMQLSNAIVRVVKDHTGRGPTKARTLIGHDLVVCVMQDTLTTAERTLVDHGDEGRVLETRHRLQDAMRVEVIATVEDLTGRKVAAFMSDNHIDPDMAVESFVLEPAAAATA